MHRDSLDNRYTSHVIGNRFKPVMVYASPKNQTFDRTAAIVNLPPAPASTSLSMRNGNLIKRDHTDTDHLTKLLMKSINISNESNVYG